MALRFEPFDRQRSRKSFSCGNPELDEWFRHRACQHMRKHAAQVFVAVDDQLGIAGFYSLSAFSIALTAFPEALVRKLPRYDAVPVALVGRLARDIGVAGKGIGDLLLADAVRRTLQASKSVGVYAIVVDAIDSKAAAFYEAFGFQRFTLHPSRLFLTLATAAAALDAAEA